MNRILGAIVPVCPTHRCMLRRRKGRLACDVCGRVAAPVYVNRFEEKDAERKAEREGGSSDGE